MKTKDHKLALSYHGSFRVLEVRGNCVLVRPVDKLDDHSYFSELGLHQIMNYHGLELPVNLLPRGRQKVSFQVQCNILINTPIIPVIKYEDLQGWVM